MLGLTILLFALGYTRKESGEKAISSLAASLLIAIYGYTFYLITGVI